MPACSLSSNAPRADRHADRGNAEQEERPARALRHFERHARESSRRPTKGNRRALLALKAYCYRVRKYIGAYVAAMGGLDAVIFTGGIGQGSAECARWRCRA